MSYQLHTTSSAPSSKRPYYHLEPSLPPFHPTSCKRPRLAYNTPGSVISELTDDSRPAQPEPPSDLDSPILTPDLSYCQPDTTSPLSQDFSLPHPLRDLPADQCLQADIGNSFTSNTSPTARWTNDLLVQVLANEVEDLIYSNDDRAGDDVHVGEFDTFYSTFKQPFELDFYMRRLVQYVNCSTAVFVSMFVYLDRVQEICKPLLATDMNCHRLVFTCLVLAVKNLEDEVHSNAYYARVGGLTIEEMNILELKLLKVLDWNLTIAPETYAVYEEGMVHTASVLTGAANGSIAAAVAAPYPIRVENDH